MTSTSPTRGDTPIGTGGRWGWFVLGVILLLMLIGSLRGDYSETWLNGARF